MVRLGRSPDADLLYRTLVTFGPRSAAGQAGDLDLSPRRVSHALDELAAVSSVAPGGEGVVAACGSCL